MLAQFQNSIRNVYLHILVKYSHPHTANQLCWKLVFNKHSGPVHSALVGNRIVFSGLLVGQCAFYALENLVQKVFSLFSHFEKCVDNTLQLGMV